ncbi:MAG: GPR endopeptidase [Lachnospira sp.]|nr:GPR endopeptidase [Lachnospira sp.]
MGRIVVRTDLAVEANEEAMNGTERIKGIRLKESRRSRTGVKVTELQVMNHYGEIAIKRPKGTYLTIEAQELATGDEDYASEVISTLAGYIFKLIKRMNKNVKPQKILVIGLGNRNITSDSLGPAVIDNIYIDIGKQQEAGVCTLSPGVMAQTGIETAGIIKGVVEQIKPDVCIAIDALAARSAVRLNSTIQLSDQGINPGSGVGNHRVGITRNNIGVPVLAIGVPTVIDAEGIVKGAGKMYVTPKDIDSDIKNISLIISKAINRVGIHIHS